MRDFAVLAMRCKTCRKISAFTVELNQKGRAVDETAKTWPKLCSKCGDIECVPLEDGELDNFADAFEAQVAISAKVNEARKIESNRETDRPTVSW